MSAALPNKISLPGAIEIGDGFWARVDTEGECWTWLGPLDRDGYGKFWDGARYWMAHRFSFVSHNRTLSAQWQVDHLCRNRSCVRPDHLEAVSAHENRRRALTSVSNVNAAKTHCKRGHAFDEKNTHRRNNGTRECRQCQLLRNEERKAARLVNRQCAGAHTAGENRHLVAVEDGTDALGSAAVTFPHGTPGDTGGNTPVLSPVSAEQAAS